MSRPPVRLRRSRHRRRRLRWVAVVLGVVVLGGLVVGAVRIGSLVRRLDGVGNPVQLVQQEIGGPAEGTVAWKLAHGKRVNILLLGYGGSENTAPYLSDTMMAMSIDPASRRIFQVSVPRDLYVQVDAWQDRRQYAAKINTAFAVPHQLRQFAPGPLKQEFQGKDGPGRLAAATVSRLTGLGFDKYVAIDFKAFRSAVDTLGGVDVCLEQALDDNQYSYYRSGRLITGIHFRPGCQRVTGEQALQLARSRTAVQPEQASDYGRAKRQQMLVNAIRKKAVAGNALTTMLPLMESLQGNYVSDLELADIKALYDFGGRLPDSATQRFPITGQDLVRDFGPKAAGSCGPPDTFVSCSDDPSFRVWHAIFDQLFVPRAVLDEKAPVQLVNGAAAPADLHDRMSVVLRNLGLQVSGGVRGRAAGKTVVYDYSAGSHPKTAEWLRNFLRAEVVAVSPRDPRSAPTLVAGQKNEGLVVVLGNDAGARWRGQA